MSDEELKSLPNPKFLYSKENILIIWENYLKSQSNVKFFTNDTDQNIADSISKTNGTAIILDTESKLYKNHKGNSLSIIWGIEFTSKDRDK